MAKQNLDVKLRSGKTVKVTLGLEHNYTHTLITTTLLEGVDEFFLRNEFDRLWQA